MKAIRHIFICILCLSASVAQAHSMKNFTINEKSFSDFKTVSMTIINGKSYMDYEIIVNDKVLGNIGQAIPPHKEFTFEIELPTPENLTSIYKICTKSAPKNSVSKTTVCGQAKLERL
jgi:hypothetical protein